MQETLIKVGSDKSIVIVVSYFQGRLVKLEGELIIGKVSKLRDLESLVEKDWESCISQVEASRVDEDESRL